MNARSFNKQFLIGAFLMAMPAFFFFSVFMELVAHNNFLVENVFVKIDKMGMGLSAFILLGFPSIAAAINLIPFLNIKFRREGNEVKGSFSFALRTLNMIIVLTAIIILSVLLAYLFVENYHHA